MDPAVTYLFYQSRYGVSRLEMLQPSVFVAILMTWQIHSMCMLAWGMGWYWDGGGWRCVKRHSQIRAVVRHLSVYQEWKEDERWLDKIPYSLYRSRLHWISPYLTSSSAMPGLITRPLLLDRLRPSQRLQRGEPRPHSNNQELPENSDWPVWGSKCCDYFPKQYGKYNQCVLTLWTSSNAVTCQQKHDYCSCALNRWRLERGTPPSWQCRP